MSGWLLRGPRYPWPRPEAKSLHEALFLTYREPKRVELLYQQAGGLRPLNPGQAVDLVWAEALDQLAEADLLAGFVERLGGTPGPVGKKAQALVAARDEEARTDASADDLVSLDRAELRARLDLLARPDGLVRTVVVRGGPQSGKTWSAYLFERCAADHGGTAVYLGEGGVADLPGVLEELFLATAAAREDIPSRADTTTPVAWYQQVWRQLRVAVERHGRPLWIAVDDLGADEDGAPLLDPEIRAFFDTLPATFMNRAPRTWFRLMLIHYPDGDVPTRWRAEHWREDRTCTSDIRAEHVVTQLREWSQRRDLRLADDHVAHTAQAIITSAETGADPATNPRCRLQRINDGLVAVLDELERSSG